MLFMTWKMSVFVMKVPFFIIPMTLLIIIGCNLILNLNNYFGVTNPAYGQSDQISSNNTGSLNIQNIPANKV